MTVASRRPALILVALAVLDAVVWIVLWRVLLSGTSWFFGHTGEPAFTVMFVLWIPLLLVAGVLALRRRRATRPELLVCAVLVGALVLALAAWSAESLLFGIGHVGEIAVVTAAWGGAAIAALAAPVLLVVAIVQTVRAPRDAA